LLPLFNKGIRKFTRVFREVFERDIAKEIDREAKAAEAMMIKAKETNAAYGTGIKKSLDEELKEGET